MLRDADELRRFAAGDPPKPTHTNDAARRQIERQVADFLRNGGEIECVSPDAARRPEEIWNQPCGNSPWAGPVVFKK